MEKKNKIILVCISVSLAILTAVYMTGIMRHRAQNLLNRGYEVFPTEYAFREYQDVGAYTNMRIKRVSWLKFQSELTEHSSIYYGKPLVVFNWSQMWFKTFEQSYESGYGTTTEWIVFISDIKPY